MLVDPAATREAAHKALDSVLDLVARTRSAPNDDSAENCKEVALSALDFLERLAGPEISLWLYDKGLEGPDGGSGGPLADTARIQRAYAGLIMALAHTLDQAKLMPGVVARDLIQMSLTDGANPLILEPPNRKRGKKDKRDLKNSAQKAVARCVYFESARTAKSIETVLARLRPIGETKNGRMTDSQNKNWKKCAATLEKQERAQARQEGARATRPHQDCERFREIWTLATSK